MKKYKMKINNYLLILLTVFVACKSSTNNLEEEHIVHGEIGEKMNNYLTSLEPFGLSGSFLLAKGDTIMFHKAYGLANRNESIENSINTLFSTGSITKQFTATAILKLEEDNLLSTSDSISKYFKNIPLDKTAITIHHLLAHTSGLPAIVSKDDFDQITREEFISKLMTSPLLFEPGSDFKYSNSAYGLLAVIIENLTGKSYDEYLSEALLKPIGISNIGYAVPAWKTMYEAHNYIDDKDYGPFQERNYPNWNLIGNGGLLTTSMDLYKWMLAIKKNKILSEGATKKLFTPNLEDFAYGWEVYEDSGKVIEHTGAGDGNNSIVQWFVDQDILFIGLSNASFAGRDLLDYLYEDIFALTHNQEIPILPSFDKVPLESIDPLIMGTYQLDSTSQIKIDPFKNGFKLQTIGQEAINVFKLKENYVPGIYKDKNEIAFEAFQLAIENDDFSNFNTLIQDNDRLNRTRRFIASYLDNSGLDQFWVIPYITQIDEGILQSYIAVSDQKGVLEENRRYPFLSITWKEDGSYRGVATITQSAKSPVYYFVKGSEEDHFIGYNWDSGNMVEVYADLSGGASNNMKIKVKNGAELPVEKIE